jgi:hypothetical protein
VVVVAVLTPALAEMVVLAEAVLELQPQRETPELLTQAVAAVAQLGEAQAWAVQAVQALSFFATPAQRSSLLVAQ